MVRSLSGGEPLVQPDFCKAILRGCKEMGLHTALDTSGYLGDKADDELLDWVRNNAETTYHPVGTCKMGSDRDAVVDAKLRVHGLSNIRIAEIGRAHV